MANGAVTYGSSSYVFAVNFQWGYTAANETVKVINTTPGGKITTSTRYSRKVFVLQFRNISDSQLTSLEAIDAYSGNVSFYPNGTASGEPVYVGLWQLGQPEKQYAEKNHVSATFTESK